MSYIQAAKVRSNIFLMIVSAFFIIIGINSLIFFVNSGSLSQLNPFYFIILRSVPFLIGIGCLLYLIGCIFIPAIHPINRALAKYGNAKAIGDEIDYLIEKDQISRVGGVLFTDKYIVSCFFHKFNIAQISDVAWAYILKKSSKDIFYFFPSYFLIIVDAKYTASSKKEITITKKDSNLILRHLTEIAPWVETGYEADISDRYNLRPNDFIANFEHRKRQVVL